MILHWGMKMKKIIQDPKPIWIPCACGGCAVIQIQHWSDKNQFYLSFFNEGLAGYAQSFWRKLIQIWYILRRGYAWSDQIIMDYPAAQELIDFLEKGIKIKTEDSE